MKKEYLREGMIMMNLRKCNSIFLAAGLIVISVFFVTDNVQAQSEYNQPESVVWNASSNCFLVSNAGDGKIIELDLGSNQYLFVDDVASIRGLHIAGNTVYAASNAGVVGYDLTTKTRNFIKAPAAMNFLNDITSDGSNFLYVTDTQANIIFKIDISAQTSSKFVQTGLNSPNGILYDGSNNRLLVCSFRSNSPIQAVDLTTAAVSKVVATTMSNLDGLTMDSGGRVYVSSWASNIVARFDANFQDLPTQITSGHDGPADIFYEQTLNVLAVPNFNANSVVLYTLTPPPTDVQDRSVNTLPAELELYDNFPNPFNPTTMIRFSLPEPCHVSMIVYDLLGNEITSLVEEKKQPGLHTVEWDGGTLPSGTYLLRLIAGKSAKTQKLILQK